MPLPATGRWNAAYIESLGNLAQGVSARSLYFANHRDHVGRVLVCNGFARDLGPAGSLPEPRVAQLYPARLGGLQRRLCAFRDHLALVLSHGGQDVHRELVGVRVIDGNELNARVHQRCDKCKIAGKTIELRDDKLGALLTTSGQCLGQFGTVVALSCFDLNEFGR
jgi:hypothetical protein